jgi:hypothetical protein
VAIEGEHLPAEVSYDAKLQSGEDPGEDYEHAASLGRFLTVSSAVRVAGLSRS